LVVLSSKIPGAELAKRLGVPGDQEWDAGEPVRPTSSAKQKFSGWSIDSRVDRSLGPGDHLQDLLKRTLGLPERIRALSEARDIDSARVWLHLQDPEIGFFVDPEALRAIANLGSLEVDIHG
jgi:hypothetical protein